MISRWVRKEKIHIFADKSIGMKKLVLCISLFLAFLPIANAQTGQLIIRQGDKGHYIDHKVVPKEGLYAIGRIYNVHPRTIADYNNIDMNAGLNIGQVLHIPLTDTNFSQKTNKGIPIYYTVGEKEGLLTVSRKNMDVTMQTIRDWNNLRSDRLNVGTRLIVGYLVTEPAPVAQQAPPRNENVLNDEPVTREGDPDQRGQQTQPNPPIASQEPEKKQDVPVKTTVNPPATNPQQGSGTTEGFFRYAYSQQTAAKPSSKMETVTSGIFKTTSGWQDAKYYMLINDVQAGTIVKLTNPENNKAVFAKVLGEMNGIRQNQGLDIRISNAAAAALEVGDTEKFILRVNY